MMQRKLVMLLVLQLGFVTSHAQSVLSLDGAWDFATGPQQPVTYSDYVMLPGSMLTNGKGDVVSVRTQWTGSLYDSSYYFNPYMEKYRQEGQMKFPFFLTPERHYVGTAWYHKRVYVPRDWHGSRVILFLERPHIETTVFVNGQEVGRQMSLSVPHEYDVTHFLKLGAGNDITVRVYNGIENVCVGQDSHSVTDQTQGNWNGIAGRIQLEARPQLLSIRSVRVYPDVAEAKAHVVIKVDRFYATPYLLNASVSTVGKDGKEIGNVLAEADDDEVALTLDLSKHLLTWDEFSPNLYRLTVSVNGDEYVTTFGMRDIRVKGRQLMLNGLPLYLRGTVENCCFPETGYPPTDVESWLRIFRKCKEYGINHVRFHSYCPPEAAFDAADRVGIYLQPEGPSWPNHGVKLRRGQIIDDYLLQESRRIIDAYGNHPSFLMMAAGNEPAGDWVSYCNDWVKAMKKHDPTKIYAGASVGGGWAWDDGSEYHVKGGARGLDWDRHAPNSSDDYLSGIEHPRNYRDTAANQSPIIAHEQGQWCAFPDFREISQYTGVYKARNFEIFRDLLADHGMADQAEKFLMASGRLQTLCYKYEIERNLRTPDYAGFQLLGLNDYSGQGTALVGPLNVHWREKGYVTANEWRQFCSPMTLLARFPKFVFTSGEQADIPVELMNATPYTINSTSLHYAILLGDSVLLTDSFPSRSVTIGKGVALGRIPLPLASLPAPAKLTLRTWLGNMVHNSWDFWVYPDRLDDAALTVPARLTGNVPFYEADSLDTRAIETLRCGGIVLLTAAGRVRYGNDVKHHYLPVFWNTSWFKMRPPHTTGTYIQNEHPMFRDFPTDDWQNLNWWYLVNRTQVMNLAEFPAEYQPPVQPIDTWHVSRKLGMIVEARVLKGRLLMTTLPIGRQTVAKSADPVARQLRYSIVRYLKGPDFQPAVTLAPDVIRHLFEREAPPVNMFTNDSPDELKPKIK